MAAETSTAGTLATDSEAGTQAARLEAHIAGMGPVLVAFSGGVDSTVVVKAAHCALGTRMLAVTARSESNTEEDEAICRGIVEAHGIPWELVQYSELAIPGYAANPANRCFHCKNELYTRLTALAGERGYAHVCDGSNAEDAGDYRPGLQAVTRHGVRSPLKELGLGKDFVRRLAAWYGLPNHARPASPCLSSRIPYGELITREKLSQVDMSERYLRGIGLRQFRCRHHGDVVRIEAEPSDFSLLLENRVRIVAEFRRLGFRWVTLDLFGFSSGSLNAVLGRNNPPHDGPLGVPSTTEGAERT